MGISLSFYWAFKPTFQTVHSEAKLERGNPSWRLFHRGHWLLVSAFLLVREYALVVYWRLGHSTKGQTLLPPGNWDQTRLGPFIWARLGNWRKRNSGIGWKVEKFIPVSQIGFLGTRFQELPEGSRGIWVPVPFPWARFPVSGTWSGLGVGGWFLGPSRWNLVLLLLLGKIGLIPARPGANQGGY